MSWRCYRTGDGFHVGLIGERWWLSLAASRGTVYVDLGPWRIRWASRDHRPLFSERYGYTRWRGWGRLKVNYAKRAIRPREKRA